MKIIKAIIESIIVRWAIKRIVADSQKTYGGMRYLEDVLTNEWGESMYIFSHRLVPVDRAKLDAANAKLGKSEVAFQDTSATTQNA